ncbi:hypothetical protein Btru_076331 [Bulinus truncatus]|nr:hypothetical protein Btru_076331 [Bulinus truncatus]
MEALGTAVRNFHFHQVFFVKCLKIKLIFYNVIKTFLHTAELVMMFTLMVIFMTLNTWLCASIIIGSAVGYLLFNWNSQNGESLSKPEFNINNK